MKTWKKTSSWTKRRVPVILPYPFCLVVEIIIELGNAILQNLGAEEKIDDVEVFLR